MQVSKEELDYIKKTYVIGSIWEINDGYDYGGILIITSSCELDEDGDPYTKIKMLKRYGEFQNDRFFWAKKNTNLFKIRRVA